MSRPCLFLTGGQRRSVAEPSQTATFVTIGWVKCDMSCWGDTDGGCRPLTRSHDVPDDVRERLRHLERLLTHHAGNISLDPENLRILVESLEEQNALLQRQRTSPDEVSLDSDYVGMDDEKCTVKPLENNITRKGLSCLPRGFADSLSLIRLLGGILALEFLHAHQELDRTMRPGQLAQRELQRIMKQYVTCCLN